MKRFFLTLSTLVVTAGASLSAQEDDRKASLLTTFAAHCVQCHGQDGKIKGKVDLSAFSTVDDLKGHPELLTSLIDVIDFEEMPPEDESPLTPGLRAEMLKELKALREAAVAEAKGYLPTPVRRMNRFQYNNAVVDLFQLKSVVFSLPERMMRDHKGYFQPESGKMADTVMVGSRPLGKSQMIEKRLGGVTPFPQDLRAEHGFDNRGDHLTLSPLLMQAFLELGQSVLQSPDFNPKNVGIWETFFAAPEDEGPMDTAIESRLRPFLTLAFRRPVDAPTLERYARFALRRVEEGDAFADAMKAVAAAALSSPRFLYLYDGAHAVPGSTPLSPYEIASRLAFFLWGSLPDDPLLELAREGTLVDPEVLRAQCQRMLKDRRLKRFCDSFPTQWLQLERIISSTPNQEKFPDFYFAKYRRSMHMMLEPLLVFETILIENRPVTDLVHSDFTYRSAFLEATYGELATSAEAKKGGRAVGAIQFQRLPVTDRRSGGVITNAAVMTMTSGPERTQPITRGAWVASVIFNHPPEPPPADVPTLGEKPPAGEEHLTLRERLAQHRERSDCRGCHERIDPLGFALENYDPVGNWRHRYENERWVDASGTLFRQHPFRDIVEFKDAILTEKNRFTRALAGHLLSFALARPLGPADEIALDRMVADTEKAEYRMQALIEAVVLSEPFLRKTTPRQPDDAAPPNSHSPTR